MNAQFSKAINTYKLDDSTYLHLPVPIFSKFHSSKFHIKRQAEFFRNLKMQFIIHMDTHHLESVKKRSL